MKISILSVLMLVGSLLAQPTWAASQEECEIWLCLPGGFGPAACSGAYDAMIDRITHTPNPKPPLPPFSECTKDGGGGGMSSVEGRGARLHAFEKCTLWGTRPVSGDDWERYCRRDKFVPEEKIAGTQCYELKQRHSSGSYYDPVQTRTCTSYKTIGVMVDGELKGDPYFYKAYDRREIEVE